MNWHEWTSVAEHADNWLDYAEPGIKEVTSLGDVLLRIWFDDTPTPTGYEIDFRPLFLDQNPGGVFRPLADRSFFGKATGDYALVWPNPITGDFDEGIIDIAPECVRYFCEKYGNPLSPTDRPLLRHLMLEHMTFQ